MSRPDNALDIVRLKALMRLKPTLEDTAAFFEVNPSTIEKFIKREFGKITFSEFRDQNMVHTRFNLIRTAIQKAEKGDNVMLIFCLKNLCGWKDKWDAEETKHTTAQVVLHLPSNGKEAKDGN
jgi:hypothetical protein